jgi:hypothetical protein
LYLAGAGIACLAIAVNQGCQAIEYALSGDTEWSVGNVQLAVTPSTILVGPVTSDSGATGSAGQRTVTVYGSLNDSSKPAEGTHVDVCLNAGQCSVIKPLPNSVDVTQYVQLLATPPGQQASSCIQVSEGQVHCVLGADGSAQFGVTAVGGAALVPIPLTAISGLDLMHSAQAVVYVGNPLPSNAVLEMPPTVVIQDSAQPRPCGVPGPSCSASQLQRSTAMTVQITSALDADASDAIPIVGTGTGIGVSIRADGPATAGNAWLATTASCEPTESELFLTSTSSGGSASFYVCADGTSGQYAVVASAASLGMAPAITAESAVTVMPEAANVIASIGGCDTDAGAADYVALYFADCQNKPAQTTATVDIGTGAPLTVASGPDGRACVAMPLATTDGGADASTRSVSVSVSSCSGLLQLGGT